jgi:hypothetical protein
MKKIVRLKLIFVLLVGCNFHPQSIHPIFTEAAPVVQAELSEANAVWDIYDRNPEHLWNRVYRQLYRRTSATGDEYGSDELDPLLWLDTTYLLDGTSYQETLNVLDEFLSTHAEYLIRDPLKRAMFQRDLWAVFDWAASRSEPFASQRQALMTRLAQIIRKVALSREEILSLPDNYTLEIEEETFPADVPIDNSGAAFLPSDIFHPERAWVPIGREGGPVAMTHTESFPFFGRSVFLVYVRWPGGREASLKFIESLNTGLPPVPAVGLDLALARRMMLIDESGDLTLSPLVESIQLRHFSSRRHFHDFELNRVRLLGGKGGGLALKTDLFMLFMGHGDVFEFPDIPEMQAAIPEICKACHFEYPRSIISYSRDPFSLPDGSRPVLIATTLGDEAQVVIGWKRNHPTWQTLKGLWNQAGP